MFFIVGKSIGDHFRDLIDSSLNTRINLKTEKDVELAVEHFNSWFRECLVFHSTDVQSAMRLDYVFLS